MKKLLSLVLICVMGFGMISCVESEESQSVTELRNAKAEQLKALANLTNAQAEAAKIAAQAEAALKAAEAEYKKAQAALEQANADYKLEELEQLKAKFAYEIEMLKAKYEAQMLEWKKKALGYEAEILEAINAVEDAARARIADLYDEYNGYVEEYNSASEEIISKKRSLAQTELEIVDIQRAANDRIAEQEKTIAQKKEDIAKWEAQLAILKQDVGNVDADSLYNEWLKARTAYNNENAKMLANEYKTYMDARATATDATESFFNSISEKQDEEGIDRTVFGVTYSNESNWREEYLYITYLYSRQYNDNGTIKTEYTTYERAEHYTPYDQQYIRGYYWDLCKINGNPVIVEVENQEQGSRFIKDAISVDIDESNLLNFKNNSAASLKTAQDNLERAEKELATSTEAKKLMEGFKSDFEKADEARKAIEAFTEAYAKYDEATETVKYFEGALVDVKADTTDGSNRFYNNVNNPYSTLMAANATLDELTNEDNEDYETNAYVAAVIAAEEALEEAEEALEEAKEALEAAEESEVAAAEAEVAAAEDEVKNKKADLEVAKKELAKAIYNAEVAIVDAKAVIAQYEEDVEKATEDIATAQENEKALLAADKAAKAAVETLNASFGEESAFAAFWNEEDEDGNKVYAMPNAHGTSSNTITLLADFNEDGEVDLNLDADNGLYLTTSATYSYNAWEYDNLVNYYTTNIADATDKVADYTKTIESLNEWVSNWDAKEAELREFVKAKNAEIEEVNALYDAYNTALDSYSKKYYEVQDMNLVCTDIMTKYEAAVDPDSIPAQIAEIEGDIEEALEDIEEAEAEIAKAKEVLAGTKDENGSIDSTATIEYKNYLIEKYKREIAKLEADLEYYAQMIETTKTALDAALSALNADAE